MQFLLAGDPLVWFRMLFFGGLLMHFGPTLLHPNASFGAAAFRTREWDPWLYELGTSVPTSMVLLLVALASASLLLGLAGVALRFAVVASATSLYVLCSLNAYYVQTLALIGVWAVLWIWTIVGCRTELLRPLLAGYFLVAMFFSGVAKLQAGWLVESPMTTLLAYPSGHVVRAWLAGQDPAGSVQVGGFLQAATLAVELGAPPLFLFARTKLLAQAIYQAFFLGIVAALEVPPLFYMMYAGGGLLSLPRSRGVARARARPIGLWLRAAIVLWIATCVLGVLGHQFGFSALTRSALIKRLFPHARYGYVMFAEPSHQVGLFDYLRIGSASAEPLAAAMPIGAWGYANARAQLNAVAAPESLRWLCRSGHLPPDSTLRLRVYDVLESTETIRTVSWRCNARRLVHAGGDS